MLVHCPIAIPYEIQPCDPAEIAPLAAHLLANRPVTEATVFPRGTALPDGRLDLCKQSLGPDGCRIVTEALTRNTRVRSLLLGTDGIGDSGADDVARLVAENPALEILYLGCNRISSAGTARLCEVLTTNRSVTGLWLKRNPIGPEGAAAVAAMLRTNRTLRTLDLVNTQIGADGLAAILDALLHQNRTVERLYLGGNGIGPNEAEHLAVLLRTNPSLKALLLNVNAIGDTGAVILADALRENQTLEELGLASNTLSEAGGAALFEGLRDHKALSHLDLGWSPSTSVLGASPNALGDRGATVAAAFLAANPPLRHLDLRKNGIGKTGVHGLIRALDSNQSLVGLLLAGRYDYVVANALRQNRERAAENTPDLLPASISDVALIRSVYRTMPR
ncbi:MAG: ribonuclease inhibitor [Cytophagales bacterium]|nr:ribonuclease inhibitor [Armatimonadota bacterium]